MPDLALAFAVCLFVRGSDPSFLPTQCHIIAQAFIESGEGLDMQTQDRPQAAALVDGVADKIANGELPAGAR